MMTIGSLSLQYLFLLILPIHNLRMRYCIDIVKERMSGGVLSANENYCLICHSRYLMLTQIVVVDE